MLQTSGFSRTAVDAFTESPTALLRQPGTVFNIRARAVCRECNGGWMSRLEQQAKSILLSMFAAERPGSLLTLTASEAQVVATWAVKTAWMREESQAGARATTEEMRRTVYRTASPPKYSKVWAARHVGDLDFNIKQAVVTAAHQDRAWDTTDVRQTMWTCLTFRGISLLSYTVDGWGVPEPRRDMFRWVRLWPSGGGVAFPPVKEITDRDVLMAVVQQPNLRMPDVPRFIRDPGGVHEHRRN
jgi:hypothetical protein